ncbi:MAG: hypothetical protein ACRCSN_04065 [Dermatophilaceae bacterium]
MVAEPFDEHVGSVAEEAARLVASLRRASESTDDDPVTDSGPPHRRSRTSASTSRDRAPGSRGAAASSGTSTDPDAEQSPHDSACRWCPVCRSVAAARQLSPETLTWVAQVASVAAAVLNELAEQRTQAGRSTGSSPDTDTETDTDTDTADDEAHRG